MATTWSQKTIAKLLKELQLLFCHLKRALGFERHQLICRKESPENAGKVKAKVKETKIKMQKWDVLLPWRPSIQEAQWMSRSKTYEHWITSEPWRGVHPGHPRLSCAACSNRLPHIAFCKKDRLKPKLRKADVMHLTLAISERQQWSGRMITRSKSVAFLGTLPLQFSVEM